MVLDSSALLAILLGEPECEILAKAIYRDPVCLISAVSVFEAGIVALARLGEDGVDELDLPLTQISPEVRGFVPGDLPETRAAYLRFGKGLEWSCEWITYDRDFARFQGLKWRTLS